MLFSNDDWYELSSGLIVLETTIGNYANDLYYKYTTPSVVLEAVRNIVADRLARYAWERSNA